MIKEVVLGGIHEKMSPYARTPGFERVGVIKNSEEQALFHFQDIDQIITN